MKRPHSSEPTSRDPNPGDETGGLAGVRPAFKDDLEFGEWLHAELMRDYSRETEDSARERVQRAADTLQVQRFPEARRRVEILWIGLPTAFAALGRYVYISGELLELLRSEDAVAFVLAHEIAHHDLGHLDLFQRRAMWQHLPGGDLLTLVLYMAQRLATSPEMERDADARALDLCLRAGYQGARCIEVFDVLETIVLDTGDIEGVYGPEAAGTIAEDAPPWLARTQVWMRERARGYPSVRERKEALQARLSEHKSGLPAARKPAVARTALQTRLDQFDRALEAWRNEVSVASANLLALTRVPTYRRMAGDKNTPAQPLAGETREKVAPAIAKVPDLCRKMGLLLDMVDRAEEARSRVSRQSLSEEALCELEHLLQGCSIPLSRVFIPFERRGLTSPREEVHSVAPPQLLDEMTQAFEAARDAVFLVEAAWARWNPALHRFALEAATLRQQAQVLGMIDLHELPLLERHLGELRARVEADPLGVPPDADHPIRLALESLQEQLTRLAQQHQQIETGLARAQELLVRMQGRRSFDVRVRAGDQNSEDVLSLEDLAQWLERLEANFKAGRWQAAGIGLDRWLKAAHAHLSTGSG
jgi:hypothetical protein